MEDEICRDDKREKAGIKERDMRLGKQIEGAGEATTGDREVAPAEKAKSQKSGKRQTQRKRLQ